MIEAISSWISRQKPWVFENNKLPIWLSKIAPIEVFAFSFGPFVFCRGKMPARTRRHETIHYHQQLEMLFIFQWILYVLFHIRGLVKEKTGATAYRQNPFELEAYDNDTNVMYLDERPLYAWIRYIK